MLSTLNALFKMYRNDIVLWSSALLVVSMTYNIFHNSVNTVFDTKTSMISQKNVLENKSNSNKTSTLNSTVKSTDENKKSVAMSSKAYFSVGGLKTYDASKVSNILHAFEAMDYDIKTIVKNGTAVQNIQPNRIPTDLATVLHLPKRKKIFISMLLPLALKINQHIATERQKLLSVIDAYEKTGKITEEQKIFINHISLEFGVKKSLDMNKRLSTLFMRVDILPVSLILAQGAVESGWGTSRFSIEGNALFGQWTWEKDKGIVPLGREEDKTHSIKTFSSPYKSMYAYVHNINSNRAYAKLRILRNSLRKNNTIITGTALAQTLNKYSEEGMVYVKKITQIIRGNKLESYNDLPLQETSY